MKHTLLAFLLALAMPFVAAADVVRPAPDFSWQGPGKHNTLKSLRGQPVVLIVAKSARDGAFRKQAKRLKDLYQEFAGRNVVFVAAFEEEGGVIPTDVPFVIANDGAKISADYQVSKHFGVIVIGVDGNQDLVTSKIVPASRIKDVIVNSYPVQSSERSKKQT